MQQLSLNNQTERSLSGERNSPRHIAATRWDHPDNLGHKPSNQSHTYTGPCLTHRTLLTACKNLEKHDQCEPIGPRISKQSLSSYLRPFLFLWLADCGRISLSLCVFTPSLSCGVHSLQIKAANDLCRDSTTTATDAKHCYSSKPSSASPTPRKQTPCAMPKRGAMTRARHVAPFRNADGPSRVMMRLQKYTDKNMSQGFLCLCEY